MDAEVRWPTCFFYSAPRGGQGAACSRPTLAAERPARSLDGGGRRPCARARGPRNVATSTILVVCPPHQDRPHAHPRHFFRIDGWIRVSRGKGLGGGHTDRCASHGAPPLAPPVGGPRLSRLPLLLQAHAHWTNSALHRHTGHLRVYWTLIGREEARHRLSKSLSNPRGGRSAESRRRARGVGAPVALGSAGDAFKKPRLGFPLLATVHAPGLCFGPLGCFSALSAAPPTRSPGRSVPHCAHPDVAPAPFGPSSSPPRLVRTHTSSSQAPVFLSTSALTLLSSLAPPGLARRLLSPITIHAHAHDEGTCAAADASRLPPLLGRPFGGAHRVGVVVSTPSRGGLFAGLDRAGGRRRGQGR